MAPGDLWVSSLLRLRADTVVAGTAFDVSLFARAKVKADLSSGGFQLGQGLSVSITEVLCGMLYLAEHLDDLADGGLAFGTTGAGSRPASREDPVRSSAPFLPRPPKRESRSGGSRVSQASNVPPDNLVMISGTSLQHEGQHCSPETAFMARPGVQYGLRVDAVSKASNALKSICEQRQDPGLASAWSSCSAITDRCFGFDGKRRVSVARVWYLKSVVPREFFLRGIEWF